MPYNTLTRESGGACAIKRHERPPHSKLQMTYSITKQIRIHNTEDDWDVVDARDLYDLADELDTL